MSKNWWKTLIGTIVAAIIVSIVWGIYDKANAYTICSGNSVMQPRSSGYPCAPITARHAHRRFVHHKMGNDRGNMLPRRLRRKLNRKYGTTSALISPRFSLGDFWSRPFGSNSCWFGGKDPWTCIREVGSAAGALLIKEMRHTTHVALRCGGEGIIGRYSYKIIVAGTEVPEAGWYGVAAYTSGCMVIHVWDKWWP